MIDALTEEFSISYTDACPSELIHNSNQNFLCVGLVSFFHMEKKKLKIIPQFKNVRGLQRKLNIQKYLIHAINDKVINPVGVVRWNFKDIALQNGEFILKKSGISDLKKYDDLISINNETLSYGQAVSLAWYSIVIATFFKEIAVVSKIMMKKKASLLIDLLSGDNYANYRNLKVVEKTNQ